jgi:hypothetical protein
MEHDLRTLRGVLMANRRRDLFGRATIIADLGIDPAVVRDWRGW